MRKLEGSVIRKGKMEINMLDGMVLKVETTKEEKSST